MILFHKFSPLLDYDKISKWLSKLLTELKAIWFILSLHPFALPAWQWQPHTSQPTSRVSPRQCQLQRRGSLWIKFGPLVARNTPRVLQRKDSRNSVLQALSLGSQQPPGSWPRHSGPFRGVTSLSHWDSIERGVWVWNPKTEGKGNRKGSIRFLGILAPSAPGFSKFLPMSPNELSNQQMVSDCFFLIFFLKSNLLY